MKPAKEWDCSEGCDLSTGVICPHLERLLPSMSGKRVRYTDDTNASIDFIKVSNPQFNLTEFTQLMRDYGFFEEWDLDLLTAKYFYGQSLRQIANDFSYVSFSTVRWRLKELHALLKERGFKPKGRAK